eukprot:3006932-Amphidinium_carterae.1
MRSMSQLLVQGNRFTGTLPNRAVAGLGALCVNNNDFEGKFFLDVTKLIITAKVDISLVSDRVYLGQGLRISESANLDRCNTLIIECTVRLPWAHLIGRGNSTALAWRRADRKIRGGQCLR